MIISLRKCLLVGALSSLVCLALIRGSRCQEILEKEDDEGLDLIEKDLDENSNNPNQEADQSTDKHFSPELHSEDHSIYANRQLMLEERVKNPLEEIKRQKESLSASTETDTDDYEALGTSDFAEGEWNLMFRAFDLLSDSLTSSLIQQIGKRTNIMDEILSRLQPQCRRDIIHVRDSLQRHKLWALRMVDSFGKIPSGLTYGKFSSPGDYEECLAVKVDELVYKRNKRRLSDRKSDNAERHKFRGKYCLIDFRLPLPERPQNKLLSIHDPIVNLSKTDIAQTFPDIANYSGYASVFYEVGYLHAFCLPSTCDVNDLVRSMGQAFEGLHILVNNTVDCEVRSFDDKSKPLTNAQWISISLISLLFLNAIFASISHYLGAYRLDKNPPKGAAGSDGQKKEASQMEGSKLRRTLDSVVKSRYYAECFSVQRNFERLTKPDPRGLTFVHYTRIVAMALTVITHTAGMGTLQAITKPADASNSDQIFRDFIPQMLANAFSSIQIFFFMAGFMLVVSTYPAIKREKGYASFPEYAIKRAIRLMPGLVATIGLNFLWPLFVDGPMLSYFNRVIVEPCETNWWRTMLFLSNFDHVEKMCLRHSYFSASDYQLHIMAFPVLILLYKRPATSLIIAFILTILGFTAQIIMVLTKTLMPFMMVDYIDKQAFFNVVHYIHHPVWNHMSAFFYGYIIGYLVVKQKRVNLRPGTIKAIWYIMMPLGLASIFAPYFWNHYKRPIYKWQMVIYILVDRLILLTTCAWLSYGTMVLGRPPRRNNRNQNQTENNLPNVVTLSLDQDRAKDSTETSPSKQTQSSEVSSKADNRLNPNTGASIPRQRSSPNILGSLADELASEKSGSMKPASSVHDLASTGQEGQLAANQQAIDPNRPQGAPRSRRRPVSNLNTLCLVLSRLTFQLYLFNMVVLWVDVNHSKYQWYISYYFIITKAFAVYIASTLMSIIFFVTLESPCLTLYIMWVKGRAEARAKRRIASQPQDKSQAADSSPSSSSTTPASSPLERRSCMLPNPDEPPMGQPTKRISETSGIQLDLSRERPTFSFIDMSSPEATDQSSTGRNLDKSKVD